MKKITFLSFLLVTFLSFGQTTLYDFEDPGQVPQFAFNGVGFGNVLNPDPVGNPSARVLEINKPNGSQWFAGLGFETPGAGLINFANGTEFTMDVWAPTAGQNIRFQVQAGLSGDPVLEPTYNRDVVITTQQGWNTLTFDFTGQPGLSGMEQYTILVIQPNYNPACEGGGCPDITDGGVWYIDNIVQIGEMVDPAEDASLSDLTVDGMTVAGFSPNTLTYNVELPNGTTMAPTVAGVATEAANGATVNVTQAGGVPGSATLDVTAPNGMDMQTYTVNFTEAPALPPAAPTPPAQAVISLISDAYTNIAIPQVDTFGGALTNFDLNTDGNEEARMITGGSGFQFNFFPGSAFVDITEAAMLHLDVYVANAADGDILRVRLFDTDPGGNGSNIARATLSAADAGNWVSFDFMLPEGSNLNDFNDIDSASSPVDLSQLALLQFNTLDLGSGLPSKEVFLSNIYFYGGTLSTPQEDLSEFKVFPNPTKNNWTIVSNNTVTEVQIFDILGKSVLTVNPNLAVSDIDASSLNKGVYFANITTEAGTSTVKLVKN